MKKFFITLIVSLCAVQSIIAQDVLITTEGDVMTVYIDDIGSSTIYYKTENSNAAQLQRIDKSKVYMIKKADGTKIDLSSSSTPITQTTTPATAQPMNTELSEEAKQRNKEQIAGINSRVPQLNEYAKIGKKADMLYYAFGISDVIANDDIELEIIDNSGSSDLYARDRGITFTIKNNTQKTVYIDLGNTFFVSGSVATAYYTPTTTSTVSSNSSGVGVNLGGVTGAMGIGGSVGKLANGVTVGGGSNSTSVSVTYSQRVIAIPPLSKLTLEKMNFFTVGAKYRASYDVYCVWDTRKIYTRVGKDDIKTGDTFNYSNGNSPFKCNFYATYSFTEDCSIVKVIKTELYVRQIVAFDQRMAYDVLDKNGCLGFFSYMSEEQPETNMLR